MAKLSDLINNKYKPKLEQVMRDSCTELGNRVVAGTPIDTGRARRSWGPNGPPVLSRPYVFKSSLPYINRLEFGYSQQAPQGMLRINVLSWQSIVNKAAR